MTWSTTEFHLQYGTLEQVGTEGADADTTTLTLQHASGWTYGENFFFIDYKDIDSNKQGRNPFNPGVDNNEFYGEWYPSLSLGKISDTELRFGPIKDIGILAGFNWAPEVESWWFLPGIRMALDLPGFTFANLDITAYQHHSYADRNDLEFKVLDEDNSWMVDFNGGYPFKIGKTSWSLEGHIEYIKGRTQENTFGMTELSSWILAQPQLRLDLGELLTGRKAQLFVGIEYKYWHNVLGESGTHDQEAQLLAVWRL